MNQIQLNALELSIAHWDRICQGLDTPSGKNCACCWNFYNWSCHGCPIHDVYGFECERLGYHKLISLIWPTWTLPESRTELALSDWPRAVQLSELILIRLIGLLPPNHPLRDQLPTERELQKMDFQP